MKPKWRFCEYRTLNPPPYGHLLYPHSWTRQRRKLKKPLIILRGSFVEHYHIYSTWITSIERGKLSSVSPWDVLHAFPCGLSFAYFNPRPASSTFSWVLINIQCFPLNPPWPLLSPGSGNVIKESPTFNSPKVSASNSFSVAFMNLFRNAIALCVAIIFCFF